MKTPNYRRLTLEDRCQIRIALETKMSLETIGKIIGKSKSTVSREIKRNQTWLDYCSSRAHYLASERRRLCHRPESICQDIESLVIHLLFERWSPEQIAGRIRLERQGSLCKQTVYNYIYSKNWGLRVLLARYNKRGSGRYLQRRNKGADIPLHISQRPASVLNRSRFGHWERDCMQVANQKLILVGVERKSRFTWIAGLENRTSSEVEEITKKVLFSDLHDQKVRSITNDRGSEFSRKSELKVPVYFCDPRKPQQRGTIENTIGRLRSYFPRSFDLSSITQDDIQETINKFNQIPRKILGFRTEKS